MCTYFFHRVLEVGALGIGEQTVRARTLRDVLHVLVAGVHQFHTITGGNVLRIVPGTAARFDVAALLNQPLYQSSLF